MRSARSTAAITLAILLAGMLLPLGAARAQGGGRDSIQLAGRTAQCKGVRIANDNHLPSEGAAAPGVLLLNPRLLNRLPQVVRLFVFSHECGHHHVGGSELGADCWAVSRGVREGWLDAKGLSQVCQSFDDAPPTATHPSGRKRCSNLDKCFATAVAQLQASKTATAAQAPAPAATPTAAPPQERRAASAPSGEAPSDAPPRLVSGPRLLATGTVRHLWDAAACEEHDRKQGQGKPPKSAACP
jgi:hypothetical protein